MGFLSKYTKNLIPVKSHIKLNASVLPEICTVYKNWRSCNLHGLICLSLLFPVSRGALMKMLFLLFNPLTLELFGHFEDFSLEMGQISSDILRN